MSETHTFQSTALSVRPGSVRHALLSLSIAVGVLMSLSSNAQSIDSAQLQDYPWNLQLSNSQSEDFNLSAYQGKTLLLSFFFTSCEDACPIQTARLLQAQQKLTPDARKASRFLSISIDPGVDTPERINNYLDPLPIDHAHWQFGRPEDAGVLHRLMKSLGIHTAPLKHAKHAHSLEHAMKIFLIDPSGRIMQRYVGDMFDTQRVAREVQTVVRLNSENRKL